MLWLLRFIIILSFSACFYMAPQPSLDRLSYIKMIDRGILHLREADRDFRSKGAFNEENLKKAKAIFHKATELRTVDHEAYDGLGAVEIRLGNKEIALSLFTKALELNPSYGRAYVHLAYLSELDGRLEESQVYLHKALEVTPLDNHALNNLGALIVDNPALNISRERGEMYILQSQELGLDKIEK